MRSVGIIGGLGPESTIDEFQRAGITMVRPTEAERGYVHSKYIGDC